MSIRITVEDEKSNMVDLDVLAGLSIPVVQAPLWAFQCFIYLE